MILTWIKNFLKQLSKRDFNVKCSRVVCSLLLASIFANRYKFPLSMQKDKVNK
jgi:hypothetical protein